MLGKNVALLLTFSALVSCSSEEDDGLKLGPAVLSRGLPACVDDGLDGAQHDGYRCVTYRAVGGISMGGGASMRIALEHPELFDVAVALGAPYIDLEYFLLSVGEVSNGGFCPREQLLANLAEIDEKDHPNTWCGPIQFREPAVPDTACVGFSGDFNHHYRGPSAGAGGSFNREASFDIVKDFALAYGNPAFQNPESTYLPPGVGLTHHVALELSDRERRAERDMERQRICGNPVRLTGFHDDLYNPDGTYPVISFCDGQGPVNGEYEPGLQVFPIEITLAVDYNDNGRRDYGEPVLAHSFERFDDTGPDGLLNVDEPGYDANSNPDPSGDDYSFLDNPRGTEGNSRWDTGEPYRDNGLDGVAGTNDFGEGNVRFDQNSNVDRAFARSPRKLVEEIDERMLDRLHIWADAGIRDFLYSAQITNQFWGALSTRVGDVRIFDDWSGLAASAQGAGETYDANVADFSVEKVGRHGYLRYGDVGICPGVDAETGRGNHVGSAQEAINRILTTLAFASARWENGDFEGSSGSIREMGSPNGAIEDFVQMLEYESEALGRKQPYVVILPPDYYKYPDKRYPVLYFLHGQGMKATDLAATVLLFLGPQMASQDSEKKRARKSDWQKMIIVLADGECQVGECHTGTFYMNHQGLDGNGARHGDAFFELMKLIDDTVRTKQPEMIPKE